MQVCSIENFNCGMYQELIPKVLLEKTKTLATFSESQHETSEQQTMFNNARLAKNYMF